MVGLFVSASHVNAQVAQSVSLAWNASPSSDVTSYQVRYGTASGAYTAVTNVGALTSATVSGLQSGQTYYLAVTARNAAGEESTPSNEVSYQAPVTSPPAIALTAPVHNSSYMAPASVSLTANVTANGQTISKVQFLNGNTVLGEDLTAPYSFTWANVNSGTYSVKARAVYGAGLTVDSGAATINVTTSPALPAPWQTVDIGTPGVTGQASHSNGVFTLTGAGKVGGASDNFRFVYQPLNADGEIRARLTAVQTANSGGSFGVMMRESLMPNSRYAFMGVPQSLKFRWQRRSNTGGSSSSTTSTKSTLPNTWVRLVRTGNTITGYKSTDGTNWTAVNSRSISMAANIYVGFAVASGNTNSANTASFTSTTVVP